jgi:phosphatidylethanolamine/phosphatidyl-N-methylethanolamine N-methyltransferase
MFRYLINRMDRTWRPGSGGPIWLFLREFVRNPGAMGALCPSSQRLAARIAQQVDLSQEGWIVELGAGTGSVTEALLRHGVRPDRLIVIERSRYLVRHLRKRFPQVRVILGDACDGSALIEDCVPLAAVVSGLPLRSLSPEQVTRVTNAWSAGIGPEVRVIQFTYAPRGASAWSDAGLTWRTDETVWGNLPPARVEVFTR